MVGHRNHSALYRLNKELQSAFDKPSYRFAQEMIRLLTKYNKKAFYVVSPNVKPHSYANSTNIQNKHLSSGIRL